MPSREDVVRTLKVLAFFFLLVVVAALAVGCASNVERSYTKCLALGGNASYIEASDLRKVVCTQ